MFNIAVSFLVLTALFSYLNRRLTKLPTTVGVMMISVAISGVLVALDYLGLGFLRGLEAALMSKLDFSKLVMQGMLSVLLFAAAIHVDLSEMKRYRWQIALLTIVGTSASASLIALAAWLVLPLVGVDLPFAYCFIFGALISPTDPIAVIAMLKSAGAPQNLSTVIAGESLFNDGVAVVLFAIGVAVLQTGEIPRLTEACELIIRVAGGGILFGLCIGYTMYTMLKNLDSYHDEILITLASVTGGYAFANYLDVSGPLAMVVAGLIIGNHARVSAMSAKTREHLDMFWDLVDSICNAVLFVLIGMAVVLIKFDDMVLPAIAAIMITLAARLVSTAVPMSFSALNFRLPAGSWKILTWGGVRGGISVALALSLPLGHFRDVVLTLTYAVVAFSILVQGSTIARLVRGTK